MAAFLVAPRQRAAIQLDETLPEQTLVDRQQSRTHEPPGFDWVVFDLGGVLLSVVGVQKLGELAGLSEESEIWERWLTCPWVREFERGRLGIAEFSIGFVREWGIELSPAQFAQHFASWTGRLFDGAANLVAEVRSRCSVACLSNSNELQWAEYKKQGAGALFDRTYLSHELDLIKPDPEIFEHVIAETGSEPDRLLFLDDNVLNVEAARLAGMRAVVVRGVTQARSALVDVGVLS